jgi:hypothetical protein
MRVSRFLVVVLGFIGAGLPVGACASAGRDPSPDVSAGDSGEDGTVGNKTDGSHDSSSSDVSVDAAEATSDAGADVDAGSKIIFLSSALYAAGDLGGLSGADAKCRALAIAANLPDANLPDSYRAWLSTSTMWASSRLTRPTVPYVLVDGTRVADDWEALTGTATKPLLHPINMTEQARTEDGGTGTFHPCGQVMTLFWSNTAHNGDFRTIDPLACCGEWTSVTSSRAPAAGDYSAVTTTWSARCAGSDVPGVCSLTARLVCLQQ